MFNTLSPNLFETVETKGETLKPFWQLLKAPESTLVVNQVIIKWVAVLYESSFEAWELGFRRTGHLSIDCEGTCSLTWLLHLSFLLQTRCLHFENLIWVIIQKYIYRERSQFQVYLESGIKMHIFKNMWCTCMINRAYIWIDDTWVFSRFIIYYTQTHLGCYQHINAILKAEQIIIN